MLNGITFVLLVLSPGRFKGHGNSFHGVGGRGSKLAQLKHALRLLLSMSSTGDEAVLLDLHEQGAIPMLIGQYYMCSSSCSLNQCSP